MRVGEKKKEKHLLVAFMFEDVEGKEKCSNISYRDIQKSSYVYL